MEPEFAWDDMTEINLHENQKHDYYKDQDVKFNQYATQQKQSHQLHRGTMLANPRLNLRSINVSNEPTYSIAFNVENGYSSSFEPRYLSETFLQENNYNLEPMTYSTNQVNLIDFIGGNQRYQDEDL